MPDSFSLDSRAVLGLLSKAHQVFSSDDVTLAFPLRSPVAFDAAELEAAMGPGPDGEAHARLAEFSLMMNWVPDGPVWPPAQPRQLDDIVRSVLNEGVWASGDRTPEEEARFSEARELVAMTNPAMQEYLALKDAWIRSREQARNNQDDALAQEAEQQAEAALIAYPQRDQIEQALDDLVALDARAPYRTREQMQMQIEMGIGTFDNPSFGRFSPVRPLPKEVIEAENWDRVSLDTAELEALASSAPQELLDHLEAPDQQDTTVSITFEYASAQLNRQWLDERLFQLRCWQFGDPDRVLSDGGNPASGECTSYVRAIVLARNVAVTKKVPPGASPSEPKSDEPQRSSMALLIPTNERLKILQSLVAARGASPAVTPDAGLPPPVMLSASAVSLPTVTAMKPVVVNEPAAPEKPAIAAPMARFSRLRLHAADFKPQAGPPPTVHAPVMSALIAEEASRAPDFKLVFQPSVQLPKPPPQEEPGLITETTPPGRLILLALICKNIGRCPNPDATFRWDP